MANHAADKKKKIKQKEAEQSFTLCFIDNVHVARSYDGVTVLENINGEYSHVLYSLLRVSVDT